MTVLHEAERRIATSAAIDHWEAGASRRDAEDLLAEVLDVHPDDLRDQPPLGVRARQRYRRLVDRRVAGEPVVLILGRLQFHGLELVVRPGVFVPRGSSELLADEMVRTLRRRRQPVAVDVATGSGSIALATAAAVPRACVWGLDIAANATALGRANAARLGLANVRFRTGDLLAPLPRRLHGRVDAVSIHPPYVGCHQVDALPTEIRGFEPVHTLSDGSEDGLGLVRRIVAEAPEWLTPTGRLHLEIGPALTRSAQALLRRSGWSDIRTLRDHEGTTRVVSGRRPQG